MRRFIAAALMTGAALMGGPAAFAQQAMVAVDAGNDALLYGGMLKPEGDQAVPFVLFAPAFVPRDLNGNGDGPPTDTYKLLAQALAAKGIGSLRTDRRGVGGSADALNDETKLTLDTYVQDTITWARFLALQPRVKCVLLLGHSEGALVAALAAQKVKTCGVIEIAAAGRPAGDLIAAQLKTAQDKGRLSEDTYERAAKILADLRAGHTVADVPLSLQSMFRPAMQPYLISWLNQDPVAAQKDLYPVLVVQGDHDAQITPEDARLLANVSRAIRLVVVPNMDHELKTAPAADAKTQAAAGGEGQQSASTQPAPLAPGLVQAIADFIAKPPQPVRAVR